MVAINCREYFPDIYAVVPAIEEEQQKEEAKRTGKPEQPGPTTIANKERQRLYLALRRLLRENFAFDEDGSTTVRPVDFPEGFGKRGKSRGTKVYPDKKKDETILFASVYGILVSRNFIDPSLGRSAVDLPGKDDRYFEREGAGHFVDHDGNTIKEEGETILVAARFIEAVTDAVKRFMANKALFSAVFDVLSDEGEGMLDGKRVITVRTRQLAEVTGRLLDDRVSPQDPQIRRFVINALSQSLGGSGVTGSPSDIDIEFPNLDAGTAVDIVKANVKAVAGIYFSAMLEELRLYAVTDKVAEHFTIGMIPLSRGPAGDKIYSWIKKAPERFTEIERRSVYGRVLGLAQGNISDLLPNREFTDLWIRFVSTVSLLARDRGTTNTRKVAEEQAHKAARDLGVNLSLHGYGIAHQVAVETQDLIHQMLDMLSAQELLTAYGVNDIWQLVDRINQMYLAGYVNGVRYRTMAQSGGEIIKFIAENSHLLASVSSAHSIDWSNQKLVDNCERWLAVTGTPDASMEQNTDPVDLRMQPTIPGFAPTTNGNGNGLSATPILSSPAIRSALEQAGIGNLPSIPNV